VTYKLTDDNALEISYRATTDAPTVINRLVRRRQGSR
jgi:galactose mutarotase-like enzyme